MTNQRRRFIAGDGGGQTGGAGEAGASAGSGAERRQAERYGCAGDAEIVVPGRGLHYRGRIVNLSVGGCFIETKCPLERGTSVEVWMEAEGMPLRLAANLMAGRDGGVACRFHGVTARKQAQIDSLIVELREQVRIEGRAEASQALAQGS